MRKAPDALEGRFLIARGTPGDINEHLDLLRELASQCEHVTEFGARGMNGSTVALLAGQPTEFITWDVNPYSIVSQAAADLIACAGRTVFQPRVGNTLSIEIEPTDFLFIDSLHTAWQLQLELERHGFRVRRYLAFHDTETYGMKGEDDREPGLRLAIRKFQKEHAFPIWKLHTERTNNNGLIVLENVYADDPKSWAKVLSHLKQPGVR